ncbi:MAG TPA: hypothetical protein VGX03_14055 [Candidatus Binatia bacterium]|jgi:hypothetical protein|nr:hypothetical protein [Candidatus Binatia bacterium]
MLEQRFREGGNLLAVYKTFFFDLPLVAMRETFAAGSGKEAVETAWKNYDEGIRLATAVIDNLYRDPSFGKVVDRALQGMLRWQQLSNAVSGAFLTRLRPTADLPTATEVRELLKEVRALSLQHSRVQEGGAIDGQLSNPPRKEIRVSRARPSDQPKPKYLMTDLRDYFEPVDGSEGATAFDSQRADVYCEGYFEPVAYPAPLRAKPQRRLSQVHGMRAKVKAVKNLRSRQKRAAALVRATDSRDPQAIPV